ncbi:MAG: ThuA domain-containing protein, partial [Planctomycetes bacterium]|nr:ThuA domain-containing protein [Planctomycetota bacterium]
MNRQIIHFLVFPFVLSHLAAPVESSAKTIRILFLGDDGHHQPRERFGQLQPVLAKRDIDLSYTDQMGDLNSRKLSSFDGLVIYANITKISPEQEKALLAFVAEGGGLVPIHCASYCFLNSHKYVDLLGAQFQRHGTAVFRAAIDKPQHPIMNGFSGFESWDETYVHHRHNTANRTVLAYRAEGAGREGRQPPPVKPTHSDDFTSANWFGTPHEFAKGQQAESVRVLWQAWEAGGHSLSQETICEKIGSSAEH